jgi:hypothetical protein
MFNSSSPPPLTALTSLKPIIPINPTEQKTNIPGKIIAFSILKLQNGIYKTCNEMSELAKSIHSSQWLRYQSERTDMDELQLSKNWLQYTFRHVYIQEQRIKWNEILKLKHLFIECCALNNSTFRLIRLSDNVEPEFAKLPLGIATEEKPIKKIKRIKEEKNNIDHLPIHSNINSIQLDIDDIGELSSGYTSDLTETSEQSSSESSSEDIELTGKILCKKILQYHLNEFISCSNLSEECKLQYGNHWENYQQRSQTSKTTRPIATTWLNYICCILMEGKTNYICRNYLFFFF